ncbi:septum formation protein [Paenochrobactrum gallinarii]|uniref:7-methyl-GTP pyrophosphatase n=1 Tax=Paenochrobactrum gallinarii TaxID=643673 RepID=A0A841LW65_9HYPH|nr:Maf-like protein [Paenochrobactrum gallinarii]MBB6260792.1 septum formation protein [Paenochrobactrum gallinarii]
MTTSLILASKSPFRAQLLKNAGLTFGTENADIDERAVEAPLYRSGATPEDVAIVLAEAKALAVSEKHPDAIIIGCDQTLSLGDEIFHKPADLEEAGKNLLKLSGKTHQLNSGIVLVKNGETIWRHVAIAYMTMRPLQPEFIGRYLGRIGDNALSSVGAYQVEGEGIQLFEKIKGDYFTIIGLPLLPLLQKLREESLIDG